MSKIFDLAAISVVISTIAGWLPNIAALFSIVWLGIQMYDWYQRKNNK